MGDPKTTATDRIARFVAYLNEALVAEVPITLVAWSGDQCRGTFDATLPQEYGVCFGEAYGKDCVATLCREILVRTQATAYLLAIESWVAPPNQLNLPPSRHPDRREALVIHYEDVGGTSVMRQYALTRDAEKALRFGDHVEFTSGKGRFVGLLKPQPPKKPTQ